jgi:N-formylglutamate amidohydrolase
MSFVFHIPHASKVIPKEYLKHFVLSPKEMNEEILKMTDHYTDQLFEVDAITQKTLKFPVSRLLLDPERFASDSEEVMSKVGMGCVYEKTHNGKQLKHALKIRDELISKYYQPHHKRFTNMVDECLKLNSKCLIVDCHSFPKRPLPYELHQELERAEICIGTDEYHTPDWLFDFMNDAFKSAGFSVAVNKPFSGSIVPSIYWKKTKEVSSVMIEVRRDTYMNESSGNKSENFDKIKIKINNILTNLAENYLS